MTSAISAKDNSLQILILLPVLLESSHWLQTMIPQFPYRYTKNTNNRAAVASGQLMGSNIG